MHVLLVPKKALASLADLTPANAALLAELFQTVQGLVAELDLEAPGYWLIVNGGGYQDVPQLHFHLVSGALPEGQPLSKFDKTALLDYYLVC